MKNNKYNPKAIEEYASLAIEVEKNTNENVDLITDLLIDSRADQLMSDEADLGISNRLHQVPNPLVIALLEALNKNALKDYIRDLKIHTGNDSDLADFKDYPMLNNPAFINNNEYERILNQLTIGHEYSAEKETKAFFEETNTPSNEILYSLVLLKNKARFGYFPKDQLSDQLASFIETIQPTSDETVIKTIKSSWLFQERLISKDIRNTIVLKLMGDLDYKKIKDNPNRGKLVKKLNNNPVELKVFADFLDKKTIDDVIETIGSHSFSQTDIESFRKSKLFEIPSYYNKADQARIIVKLMTGMDLDKKDDLKNTLKQYVAIFERVYQPFEFRTRNGEMKPRSINHTYTKLKSIEKKDGNKPGYLNIFIPMRQALNTLLYKKCLPLTLQDRLNDLITNLALADMTEQTTYTWKTLIELSDLMQTFATNIADNHSDIMKYCGADVSSIQRILEDISDFRKVFSEISLMIKTNVSLMIQTNGGYDSLEDDLTTIESRNSPCSVPSDSSGNVSPYSMFSPITSDLESNTASRSPSP